MTFGAGMGSSAQWRRTWKWTCRRRRRTRTFAGGWSQCPWCSYAYVLYSHSIRIRRILLINLTSSSPPPPPSPPPSSPLLLLFPRPAPQGWVQQGWNNNEPRGGITVIRLWRDQQGHYQCGVCGLWRVFWTRRCHWLLCGEQVAGLAMWTCSLNPLPPAGLRRRTQDDLLLQERQHVWNCLCPER